MNDPENTLSPFSSAAEQGRALARDGTTSKAIVRQALDRIAAHDGTLHAFISVFGETAMQSAEESDRRRGNGATIGPLDGLPFAVKDLFHLEGYPTRAGSLALPDTPAATTANAVKRLVAAGMIPLGKVHTVEFAFGGWGTNPITGTPLNPRDLAVPRAPGGSSSGSGVAVAAGLVPAALGTDTGGSVRNPAAMCGVVGLKTSHGLVGRSGLLPLAASLDTIGPLARSVEDAALLLSILAGRDAGDPATFGTPNMEPLAMLENGVAGMHLRTPSPRDLASVQPAVLERFRMAVSELRSLGAEIEEKEMPRPPEGYKAIAGDIMAAEAWHHLGRYVEDDTSVVHHVIRDRVLRGRGLADSYLQLMADRRAAQVEFDRYLAGADAFLTPTSPIVAPPLTEVDEAQMPLGTFTRFVNMLNMAALSVPVGLIDGLPAALQIMVRRFEDATALQIGRALEKKRGTLFEPPPGFD